MKKLKLEIDTLRVKSFDTAAATADARGTVHARSGDGSEDNFYSHFCAWPSGQCGVTTLPGLTQQQQQQQTLA
jgi:hypothetical protein